MTSPESRKWVRNDIDAIGQMSAFRRIPDGPEGWAEHPLVTHSDMGSFASWLWCLRQQRETADEECRYALSPNGRRDEWAMR